MWQHNLFHNREEAGRLLAEALKPFEEMSPVILALPRGGVPVAFEVAKVLGAPLDVLLVRKIGVPGHEELALGAVVGGESPQLVLNENVAAMVAVPPTYLETAKRRELEEIDRRRRLYRGDEPPAETHGRTVIVVDDGIATGATVKAALRGVRATGPGRLVLAVPVAPGDTIGELASECDDLICLETPSPFHAVGLHYADFGQTSDEEVINLLAKAKRLTESRQPAPPGAGAGLHHRG